MKTNSAILILLITSYINVNAQNWEWVQTIRPGGNEYCWSIANDIYGNIYTTGRVKANSTFGSGTNIQSPPYITVNQTDVFVAKYRSDGTLVWVKRDGGKEADWGRDIAVDKYSNTYVVGDYTDTANFGTFQIIGYGGASNRNIFLAKYDSSGVCLWAKTAGNSSMASKGYAVTVDSIGNSYITGYVGGVTSFDGISFGTAGKTLAFIAKFNSIGTCLFVKTLSAQYLSEGQDIKINKNDDVYLTGDYRGTLYVNALTFPGNSSSWSDVFLIKMDTLGNFIWATTAIGAYQDQANSVDFDSNGNIYIAGTYANDLTFGTTTINSLGWASTASTANAKADSFIAKYDANGNFKWVKTIRNNIVSPLNPNDLSSDDLHVDRNNNVLISGYVIGNSDFDGALILLDSTHETGYVTAFDTVGNIVWNKLTGNSNNSAFVARGVCSDVTGKYYVGGEFYGTPYFNFDTITEQSYNGWDGFIGRFYYPIITSTVLKDNDEKVLIFPNPTEYFINIEIPNFKPNDSYFLTIYNLFGGIALSQIKITSSLSKVQVSNLNSGIYFLEIYSKENNKREIQKIIIK